MKAHAHHDGEDLFYDEGNALIPIKIGSSIFSGSRAVFEPRLMFRVISDLCLRRAFIAKGNTFSAVDLV